MSRSVADAPVVFFFLLNGCHRSGNGQEILFLARENLHFEEKSGKIEIIRLI